MGLEQPLIKERKGEGSLRYYEGKILGSSDGTRNNMMTTGFKVAATAAATKQRHS